MKTDMRHVKLIVAIAAVTFVLVFVVKHLMWMEELEKGTEEKRLSDSSMSETAGEEKKYQDYRGRMESPVIHEEETGAVQERHTPAEIPVKTGQQREMSDYAESVRDARSLQEDTKLIYEKDAGEAIDYSGRRRKEPEKQNEKKEPDARKTSSTALKKNTVSITLKDDSPPRSGREPSREVNNNSTQHPTSTVPQ